MDPRNGEFAPIRNSEDEKPGKFDKPLPCFGCGIGWFCLLLGFACPLLWYYPTILYFSNYYHKDPRERAGLAASAIAALIFTSAALITLAVFVSTTVSAHVSLIN
ncbi:hypothetical protein QN277_022330 [Acacia crassicarpa]|uniref:60S ribosomal protein L18a-like protein n=1 Tax=Acacia crassicarpa TaxID=499986 RepID=A0AAE1JEV3_9FABA|nr:hypothetical protein QN277_022330 [Acacia crassicarpa]